MNADVVGVILAGGKGRRIKARGINKAVFTLAGRPMINYTLKLLNKVGFKDNKIIIVVGFAKESIINFLGNKYVYAEQKQRLGTAHALRCALTKIPSTINHVFVCHADDTAFYPAKVMKELIASHLKNKAELTFLTVEMNKPNLGRVLRDKEGNILGIIEQQNLKPQEKAIKEINCGCYCFSHKFLNRFLPKVKKNPLSGEYYLTELIEIGIKYKAKINSFKMDNEDYFQGINTREELDDAERKMKKFKLYD